MVVATCLAADTFELSQPFAHSNRKLLSAQASGLDAFIAAPELDSSQCTKLDNSKKDKCPHGQELACCLDESCVTFKDFDLIGPGVGKAFKTLCAVQVDIPDTGVSLGQYKACCNKPDKKAGAADKKP
jgi:hypothetical protein